MNIKGQPVYVGKKDNQTIIKLNSGKNYPGTQISFDKEQTINLKNILIKIIKEWDNDNNKPSK